MLGIVRLFSEQVKETEKEATTCLRRIMHRTAHAKPVGTSLIDTLVEPGLESQDLMEMWKKNRRLLHMIDCAAGTAPTLHLSLSDASVTAPGADLNSTIWRDHAELLNLLPEPDLLRGDLMDVDSSFIALPHLGAPLSWPSDRTSWTNQSDVASDTALDPMRGDLAEPDQYLPAPRFDMPLDDTHESSHFLDRLVEDHDGFHFDQEDLMRSALNESLAENVHEKLDDLLAPALVGAAMADEPLLRSLYDGYVDRYDEPGYKDDDAPRDMGDVNPAVEDLPEDPSTIEVAPLKKTRHKTFIVDEEPKIAHTVLKNTINKFSHLPPRSDRRELEDPTLLESRVLTSRLASKNFMDVDTVMALPSGKSFQVTGALAYARLVCMTHLTNGASTASRTDSINEMSVLNPERSIAAEAPMFGAYGVPNGSVMDMIQGDGENEPQPWMGGLEPRIDTSYGDYGQDEPRGLWGDLMVPQATGSANHPSEDDEELVVRFGDGIKPTFGVTEVTLGGNAENTGFSGSQLLVSSQISNSERQSRSTFQSEVEPRQPPEGLSRALLSYLAVKAAPVVHSGSHHSGDLNSASSSNASTSTSAEARKMSASLVDASQSQGGAPFSVSSLLLGSKRRTAAKTFLHLLELAHSSHIMLIQENPFDDIAIAVIQ